MPTMRSRSFGKLCLTALHPLVALAAATFVTGCASLGTSPGIARVARADSLACAAIAGERDLRPDSVSARTVGVLPLNVSGPDSSLAVLAYGLADLITTDLARAHALKVVERLNVDALLRELALAKTDRADQSTTPRVGLLLGANRLVVGHIEFDREKRLSLTSMIVHKDGSFQAAEGAAAPLDRILDAQKVMTFSLLDRLHVVLTPAEREAIEQRPTRNVSALLAYSRGVRDEARADYASASREYANALRLDPRFDRARARLQELPSLPGVVGDVGGAGAAALHRALALAGDPINRPALPRVADAVDPSFRANVQQMVTLIIRISVP